MKDSILGIPFYRFYYPHDIKEVEEACKRLNYRHNDCNWIWDGVQLDGLAGSNLHRLPEFEILFNWID